MPFESSPGAAAAGLPGRAPEDRRPQHLGKIQTALLGSIAPVLTAAFPEALISSVRSARHNLRKTIPSVEAFVDALHQGGLKEFSGMLRRNITELK